MECKTTNIKLKKGPCAVINFKKTKSPILKNITFLSQNIYGVYKSLK